MVSKKTLFLGLFAIFSVVLPIVGMEEKQGKKRSHGEMSSGKEEESKDSKKQKEEFIILSTVDGKEVKLLRRYAELSRTLKEYYLDDDGFDSAKPVLLSNDEAYTKKNLKQVKKVLKVLCQETVSSVALENITTMLFSPGQASEQLHSIINFLDLQEQIIAFIIKHTIVPDSQYCFFACNGQKILINEDVLFGYQYFRVMIQAGMTESISRKIKTDLAYADLTLILNMMQLRNRHLKNISESEKEESNNSKECQSGNTLHDDLEKLFDAEQHSIVALISQTHEWNLTLLFKGLIQFVLKHESQKTIEELLQMLPINFDREFFSNEVITQENIGILLNVFLNRFMHALFNQQEVSIAMEQEKEKEVDVKNSNTQLHTISLEPFYVLENFIKQNSSIALIIDSGLLNTIIEQYDIIVSKLGSNPQLLEAFEALLKSIFIYKLPNDIHVVGLNQENMLNAAFFRAILSNNRYIAIGHTATEGELRLMVGDCLGKNGCKLVPVQILQKNSIFNTQDDYCFIKTNDELAILNLEIANLKNTIIAQSINVGNSNIIFLPNGLFCIQHPETHDLSLINIKTIQTIAQNKVDAQVKIALLFRETTTIIFIFDNNQIMSWNYMTNKSTIISGDDNKTEADITAGVTLNQDQFVLGYSTGRLCLFNKNTGFERELQGESSGLSFFDQPCFYSIENIYDCQDGKHCAIVFRDGKERGCNYNYEIWDIKNGVKVLSSGSSAKRLLVGVQNGYLIIVDQPYIKYYFMPLFIPCSQIIQYIKERNFKF